MSEAEPFVDYYTVLQVEPDCEPKALEAAYRHLAKLYHPDHTETTDVVKFGAVIDAFRVLKNPDRRAEYDQRYYASVPGARFTSRTRSALDELAAIDDAEAHEKILLLLYKRRRERAQDAGVVGYYVMEMLACSDELFEFHLWYLKSKGFIEVTEQGTIAITIQGIDHVISRSRTAAKEKLLLTQADAGAD